jgi:MSHA pilin protein MshA
VKKFSPVAMKAATAIQTSGQGGQTMKSKQRMRGHTLLETVAVTTILGGLSAVAVPRFTDWTTEARVAVVRSMEGAVHSASVMVRMGCVVRAGCSPHEGVASVRVGGDDVVSLFRGYPTAGDAAGIANALEYKGFDAVHLADATVFRQQGAPHPERCAVIYLAPQADGAAPRITSDVSGC